jgi:hypothetical protein
VHFGGVQSTFSREIFNAPSCMIRMGLVINISYVLPAVLSAAAAGGCFFRVWHRMRSLGYPLNSRRSFRRFATYCDYWRLAPGRTWSRIPLALGIVCIVACFYFLLEIMPLPRMDC